jgi:flagellar biosynthesis chaperone FliJ
VSAGKFPLEPLCTLRAIRLKTIEAELRRCREHFDQIEARRLEAVDALDGARRMRQTFADASWQQLFEQGGPTGSAMDRHERHLAWLDHAIEERQVSLQACEQASAEASITLDGAVASWRKARSKLDAVGEMKQEWQRTMRSHEDRREEQNMEELMLRQASIS